MHSSEAPPQTLPTASRNIFSDSSNLPFAEFTFILSSLARIYLVCEGAAGRCGLAQRLSHRNTRPAGPGGHPMGARAGCPPPHLAMEQRYHYGTPVPTITPSPMRAWSSLEDERLAWLVETRQPEQLFREALPGRSDAECRDRWERVVHPLRDYKAKEVTALLSKQVEIVAGLTCEVNRLRSRLDESFGIVSAAPAPPPAPGPEDVAPTSEEDDEPPWSWSSPPPPPSPGLFERAGLLKTPPDLTRDLPGGSPFTFPVGLDGRNGL